MRARLYAPGVAACVIALGSMSLAHGQAGDDWPKVPNAARSGDFAAIQVATTDPQGFKRDWLKPGAGAHQRITHSTHLGQELDVFVNFRGCHGDRRGRCRISGDFTVLGPKGAVVATKTLKIWPSLAKPHLGTVSLGVDELSFKVDGQNAVGDYKIVGVIEDEVSKRLLRTVQTISVLP